MASKPPVFKVPPAPAKKGKGPASVVDQMFRKYGPKWLPYESQVLRWAKAYHVDPAYVAAVLLRENASANPGAVSSTGAVGPAQIQDGTVDPSLNPQFAWDGPTKLTAQWKQNFANAVKYTAWRVSGAVNHYGSLDAAYSGSDSSLRGYNPGFTGVGPSQFLPKGYIPSASPTPSDQVPGSVAASGVRKTLTDPWVVQTKGGFKFVTADTPPPGTVLYGGQPITRSQYNQVWKQTYSDTFQAYTGRAATPHEITNILSRAPSVYSLANELAAKPGFDKSPVWKQHAPGLVSYARTVLGENWNPSGGIIRKAIAQNWDQATFYAHLKQLPAYEKGPEFQDNRAKMQASYEQIYGKADPGAQALIHDVTKQGWTPDEFQSWLRSQDAYKQTPEYQTKSVSFLTQLGLITGANPTLSDAQVNALGTDPNNPFAAAAPAATGPGAAPNRPDNRPGPRGAAPGQQIPVNYPPAVRPQTKTPVGR